jgi:hypothetical protein
LYSISFAAIAACYLFHDVGAIARHLRAHRRMDVVFAQDGSRHEAMIALALSYIVVAGGRAMEYVIVKFPTRRLVYIDDEKNGYTNEVLRVDAGTHVFRLGNVANFRPASRTLKVKDTTVLEPLQLKFYRKT